jgi:acyl CoA:acetate/3-ketoacid CoA transferase beta subunit
VTDFTDFTIDEVISVCISRQVTDGEIVVQGLATPLVAAGYLLAKRTHAPNLMFASAIGQGLCREWAPLGLARVEGLWLDKSLLNVGFARAIGEVLPRLKPLEFFRPAQMDRQGNFNNIAMGSDYRRPKLRLPGTGGIPDVTTYEERVFLYVPRHSRVTFVPKLDFLSGLGHTPNRTRGAGPCYLVTDLGQFDFAEGRLRLTSIHPGATLAQIKAKTGFELDVAPDCGPTAPPSAEEVRLLREEIDPLGVRRLELLGGTARRDLLREILEREGALD